LLYIFQVLYNYKILEKPKNISYCFNQRFLWSFKIYETKEKLIASYMLDE